MSCPNKANDNPNTNGPIFSDNNLARSLAYSRFGGLQSNRSNASVLHGPTSLSMTGLGSSASSIHGMLVSTLRLCALFNFLLGSVFLINSDRPVFFFLEAIMFESAIATAGSFTLFVRLPETLGRLRCSQSWAVLGIGASFSLLTRLKLRFGDLCSVICSSPIGSYTTFFNFFGFCWIAASSAVSPR